MTQRTSRLRTLSRAGGAAPGVRTPSRGSRLRPWIAAGAAAVSLGAVVGGFAPLTYAAPVVGLLLAFAAPPDRVEPIPTIAGGRRNTVIAAVVVATLAVVVWQPQRRFVLTRRNLILSLTAVVTVAAWYGSLGHSFLPIAVLVIVVPSVVGGGRLVAARREGLEYRLLRAPLSDGLGAHRLQLLNVVSCCPLVALTAPVGTYAALAVQLTGSYRALLILFSAGLVAPFSWLSFRSGASASRRTWCWGPGRSSGPLSWFWSTGRPPTRSRSARPWPTRGGSGRAGGPN